MHGERLSHLDDQGNAHMVDVAAKPVTVRRAVARAVVEMSPQTAALIAAGDAPKGDVLAVTRIAAIQAVKRADELIPLAHPLPIDHVAVDVDVDAEAGGGADGGGGLARVEIRCEVGTTARTGVEMEAMTGCAVGALTLYDMVKGVERGVRIVEVALVEKRGGRSGVWHEGDDAP